MVQCSHAKPTTTHLMHVTESASQFNDRMAVHAYLKERQLAMEEKDNFNI